MEMKKIRIISIVICLLAILFLGNAVNAVEYYYQIIDLGTLGFAGDCIVNCIVDLL
jgi:hypothetical protein